MRRAIRSAAIVMSGAILAACGTQPLANAGSPLAIRPHHGFSLATDQVVARDQARLQKNPADWAASNELAAAYLQKVREVGDPSYYPKVDALLTAGLAHDPRDAEATTLMGSLELARHHFTSALTWGQRAHDLNPYASRPLGVISDAQLQLGRYTDAVASLQRMVDLRPDLSSYSRVSYMRELYGDVPGAISAMKMAIAAGGPVPENAAYTEVLLGTIYFNNGRLSDAESQYQHALLDFPGYVQAEAGIASIRAAQGNYAAAILGYQRAIDSYPIPQYVIALGDVYAISGNARRAAETYDLAAAEQRLFQANGVDLDQELALFDADHQRDPSAALAAARRASQDRPNIITSDSLAWTLSQTGDSRAALTAAQEAHKLGTRDALLYFHSGMIEIRLGQTAAGIADLREALRINPYFSLLWAPVARQTIASAGGAS